MILGPLRIIVASSSTTTNPCTNNCWRIHFGLALWRGMGVEREETRRLATHIFVTGEMTPNIPSQSVCTSGAFCWSIWDLIWIDLTPKGKFITCGCTSRFRRPHHTTNTITHTYTHTHAHTREMLQKMIRTIRKKVLFKSDQQLLWCRALLFWLPSI